MEPTVVRIRRRGGQVVQDCDLYIGRRMTMGGWNLPESKWANPFPLKSYSLEESLKKYEEYIESKEILLIPTFFDNRVFAYRVEAG